MSKKMQAEVLVSHLKSLLNEKDDKIKKLEEKLLKCQNILVANFNQNFEKTTEIFLKEKDKEIATLKSDIKILLNKNESILDNLNKKILKVKDLQRNIQNIKIENI